MAESTLKTLGMDVGYTGKVLIADISFEVHPGEILTLIGPNGAGKSTILRSISGQLALIGGAVYLNGRDLSAIPGDETARQMSVLFTDRVRPELMTCREVAQAGRYPYTGRLGLLSREDHRIVEEMLQLTGAAQLADRPFEAVSDGQRQRVLLSRALCQQPKVLILDEPTSFLDIRYKLEILTTLRKMVREQGLSVIMSLHELDLARRVSDRILCVSEKGIDRIGTPEECFEQAYLADLFHMSAGSYDPCFETLEYGPGSTLLPKEETAGKFEHYIVSGGKRLRLGYTTGTCAALAAAAAARRLLFGTWPDTVALTTAKGIRVEVVPEEKSTGPGEDPGWASCAVRKDAGDDIDVTNGILIFSRVEPNDQNQILIEGGRGVGRVTRPGLDQKVGEAAINHVPRQMIRDAVEQTAQAAGYTGGLTITVSVPDGERLAQSTFNPGLGIEGGISILGTSGIVEPMSTQALIETIRLSLRQARQTGAAGVILAPGNYAADFLKGRKEELPDMPVVKCSNFLGDAIDDACALGFERILLVGHAGKLVKLAGGIMNTHSRQADCRTELFCAHAALCGADRQTCLRLMEAATSAACIDILREKGLEEPVMNSLLEAIQKHLSKRAADGVRIGAVLFTNTHGLLGCTQEADAILQKS